MGQTGTGQPRGPTTNPLWRMCLLRLLQAFFNKIWETGINQGYAVGAPADTGLLLLKLNSKGAQGGHSPAVGIISMWHLPWLLVG